LRAPSGLVAQRSSQSDLTPYTEGETAMVTVAYSDESKWVYVRELAAGDDRLPPDAEYAIPERNIKEPAFIDPVELADDLGVDPGTVTAWVEALVRYRYLEPVEGSPGTYYTRVPEDRRGKTKTKVLD